MKKLPILILIILLCVGIVSWLRTRSAPQDFPQLLATNSYPIQGQQLAQVKVPPETSQKQKAQLQIASSPKSDIPEDVLEFVRRTRADPSYEWKTPIAFYGKAIDENTNPVEGAKIYFSCNDLSEKGTSFYHAESDGNGLFSISGISGKLLVVNVTKEGFYKSRHDTESFYYAGQNENFRPDAANPVIFHLKKKGAGDSLIALAKTFQVSISGKPFDLDLKTGEIINNSQNGIEFQFVRSPIDQARKNAYDWKFTITVPNGGLVATTGEFNFTAPTDGYAVSDTIDMPLSLGQTWQGHLYKEYFLKFGDGTYGRIAVDLMTHNGSVQIQSFINPSGSRSLEPQQ